MTTDPHVRQIMGRLDADEWEPNEWGGADLISPDGLPTPLRITPEDEAIHVYTFTGYACTGQARFTMLVDLDAIAAYVTVLIGKLGEAS